MHGFPYYIDLLLNSPNGNSNSVFRSIKPEILRDKTSHVLVCKLLLPKLSSGCDEYFYIKNWCDRASKAIKLPIIDVVEPVDYALTFSLHSSTLIRLLEELSDTIETSELILLNTIYLLDLLDAFTIVIERVPIERHCQMITNMFLLIEYSRSSLRNARKTLMMNGVRHLRKGVISLADLPKSFYRENASWTFSLISLNTLVNCSNLMSREFIIDFDIPDLMFYYEVIIDKAIPEHLRFSKSIIVNSLKAVAGKVFTVSHLKSDLDLAVANLFNSTFFGLPVYFYNKYPTRGAGDTLILYILDNYLRLHQVYSMLAEYYDASKEFGIMSSIIFTNIGKLLEIFENLSYSQRLLEIPKDFYLKTLKKRIRILLQMWHLGKKERIEITRAVGNNSESHLLYEMPKEWLKWISLQFKDSPKLLKYIAMLHTDFDVK